MVAPSVLSATVPDSVPAAEKLTAPADDTPVPWIVTGSLTVDEVAISRVPLVTLVAASLPLNAPAVVIFSVPYATDVAPVYVFVADKVNVPVSPDALPLVNELIGVSIGSAIDTLPAPTHVRVGVPVVASNALPETTSNVNVSAELPIVAAALSVTAPVTELLLARLSKAPVPEPLPPIVNGSETESPEPSKCTAPVLLTSVTPPVVPSATFLATLSTPAETLVVPV